MLYKDMIDGDNIKSYKEGFQYVKNRAEFNGVSLKVKIIGHETIEGTILDCVFRLEGKKLTQLK